MSDIAIKIENISKQYRLGVVGTGTISHDLNRWWHLVRGKEDPYLKVGQVNDRALKATSDYVWALKDINFEVKQGDVVGIIGKNGAGKSTLLKILSRVTSPSTGSIKAKGRIASLLEVGTGFHPELTGRENIYMNGTIMGMTKAEITRKLDEIVDFAGVEMYIDTPAKRYSSGMTVRLGFAIAAHLEPEILVVDEVLAVGDAEFQKKAIGKMQDVSQGGGRTVLFVSHNMASVRRLCSTGILLENGTVSDIGTIEDVTDLYLKNNLSSSARSVTLTANPRIDMSILSVSVFADGKSDIEAFNTLDCLKVRIVYEVHNNTRGANIACTLTQNGTKVFNTWDIDCDESLLSERLKGVYETEFTIPSDINYGTYYLSISCGLVGVGVIQMLEDVVSFDIENFSSLSIGKSYTRGGIIKTNIPWSIRRI